ncbi:MAG: hypothetical protein RR376_25405 [Janthinobacterium sp.]|jgi:hypothetical protein
MRLILSTLILASTAVTPVLHAQTMMTISALQTNAAPPPVVFISDAGREGLFYLSGTGTAADADGATAILSGNKLYKRSYSGALNAKWFGLSEASNNNTPAVTAAIQRMKKGQELLIDAGEYQFQGSLHLPANKRIRFTALGTLVFGAGDGLIVENTHDVFLERVIGRPWTETPDYSTYTGAGVTLLNASNTNLTARWISGFKHAIKLTGDGVRHGSQYNKVTFDLLYQNAVGLYLTTESGGSLNWVNENTFTGGRIAGETGLLAEKGPNQTDHFNGNKFYNIGFESLVNGIVVDHFSHNTIIAPRYEQVQHGINLKSNTYYNTFVSSSIYEASFVGNGTPGYAGKYTTVLGNLLTTGGIMSGALSVSNGEGKFLSVNRDPSQSANGETLGKILSLSNLLNVTP